MRRGAAAVVGGFLLVAYAFRHPVDTSGWLDAAPLSLPDIDRLLSSLHAVGALALLNLTAHALGAALHSRLFHSFRVERLVVPLRLGLGLLVVANAVLVLAAAHLLHPWSLVALVATPALVWALFRVRAGVPDALTGLRLALARLPAGRALALTLLLAGPFLRAFGPVYGWDALTYHLALPERYLFFNGIYVTPFSTYTAFPLNTEMLYTLALGTAGPALAKLINLEFGCLVLWILFAVGRTYSRRCAWLALLFLVSEPLFVWELTVAYSDLPLAFYAVLTIAVLERWLTDGDRRTLLLAGLLAGACLATRYPGAAVPVAAGAGIMLTPGARPWRERARAAVIVSALSVAVLAPWLLRNLVFTGNPFAPALQGLFYSPGDEYFDVVAVEQQVAFSRSIGMGRSLGAFLTGPWNLVMHPSPGLYTGGFGLHLGPLGLLAIVLVPLVRDRPPLVRLSLVASAVLFIIWFETSQEARFLLPVCALLALCGGYAMDRLLPTATRHTMTVLWALPLLAALHCHWPMWGRLGHDYQDALVRPASEIDRAYGPAQEMGARLREGLKGPHRILLVFESRGYFFHGLDYVPYHINEGSPTLQLIHGSRSPADLRSRLAALGITHVVVNSRIQRQFRPVWVPRYGPADFRSDLELISSFWRDCAQPLLIGQDVVAATMMHACHEEADPARADAAPEAGATRGGTARAAEDGERPGRGLASAP